MEKIGVIGQGFVGSAVQEGMKNYYDVHVEDQLFTMKLFKVKGSKK